MSPPLVTVVTSTWERPETLLSHAVASVDAQSYPEIEHVVVIDGYDQSTIDALRAVGYTWSASKRRLVSLGRNWSLYSGDGGYGATCRLVGAWMGAGEFITYLDDDVCYEPAHIEGMVATFEEITAFVVCPWYGPVPQCPGPPPGVGRTDTSTIMHRAIVLRDAGGFHPDGYAGDGYLVERFMRKGLPWKFKEGATVYHPDGVHHGGAMP